MYRVLILEDDDLMASSLARALRARDFDVATAATLREAEMLTDCDLVLCDLGLPDGDGLVFIENMVASRPDVPIIALTARTDESDIVSGLVTGAVDYVTKPFRLAELIARIDAQLRRRAAMTTPPAGIFQIGDLHIDVESRRVRVGTGDVDLRPKEFDLLVRLAIGVGNVVRRERLISEVWDENWWGSTKTLDVHVNSIRRKLGERPGLPSRITAVRGVGYRLESR